MDLTEHVGATEEWSPLDEMENVPPVELDYGPEGWLLIGAWGQLWFPNVRTMAEFLTSSHVQELVQASPVTLMRTWNDGT